VPDGYLELRDTEAAHRGAVQELARMKETMEKMEEERAAMVAEVEAQIERALASMAVDLEESDYTGSRPQSRLSSASGMQSRVSDAETRAKMLRSFATDSTLAEKLEEDEVTCPQIHEKELKLLEKNKEPSPPPKKKRFSASELEAVQDGMNAVDEGISIQSDRIAQKVLEIQQKASFFLPFTRLVVYSSNYPQLESALTPERRVGRRPRNGESEGEDSEATSLRSKKHSRKSSKINTRTRSGTTSSAYAGTDEGTSMTLRTHIPSVIAETGSRTPTGGTFPEEVHHPLPCVDETEHTFSHKPFIRPSNPGQHSPTTFGQIGPSASADESDTDFQSAYSASPRDSRRFGSENLEDYQDLTLTIGQSANFHCPNVTSTATTLPDEDADTSGDSVNTLTG